MEAAKFLVDGEWRSSGVRRPVFNPYLNESVGEVCQASARDIDDAIGAAEESFAAMRRLTAYDRSIILSKAAGELERRKEEFAQLITSETGKPISFSRGEVERSIFSLLTSAEEARRMEGVVLPLDVVPNNADRAAIIRRFPLGPIGAITPFNFPLNLVCHKVGPAFATGNTVVLKPSSSAPRTALLLGELFDSTSLPRGALNIVPCQGSEAEQIITDKRIKMLTFTGSPVVGWGIKARCGKKKVTLELGGNAGVIVGSDADVDHALQRIVRGAFGNAGQSCISVQRIYVHESIEEQFTQAFIKLTRSIASGDPMNERTIVGPMIDELTAKKVEDWISEAVASGARLLCGGGRKGAVLEPTVLTDVAADMKVSCNEVFAPLVSIGSFSDMKQAVSLVNASTFGLQAGIFTNNAADIFYAYRELEVGGVIVNDASTYRIDHMPYGGMKDSGFGREGIRYAMEEMTELKLLSLNFS